MANSVTESDSIDRLPDALLVTILSFLPTHIAARTSVLCRRFRHLWETSPSLALISQDLPHHRDVNFIAMSNRALLSRNPSYPLLSLCLDVSRCDRNASSFLSSLLAKALSLDLRHLTIKGFRFADFLQLIQIIFTIKSLRCLSLYLPGDDYYLEELKFPSGINLTSLRSLSLKLCETDLAILNPLLSELCSLEDLHLHIEFMSGLSLSSKTITKLKLDITYISVEFVMCNLSLPSLELLHLEIFVIESPFHIHGDIPLLRKAVINLPNIYESYVSVVAGMLNFISHVEELNLHLKEIKSVKYPIHILLESGKDMPEFHKLEHLDLTLCFHEHNLQAVTTMLHNCPALKSLKLVHEVPEFTGLGRERKRKDWGSRLPRNTDGNYRYAYFKNLHLEENRNQIIKLLSKKCSSKRCLSLDLHGHPSYRQELKFPSGINLTSLRSLSLKLYRTDMAFLNPLLSELCSLEDLHLYIMHTCPFLQENQNNGLSISSKRIRKFKLVMSTFSLQRAIVNLSLPSLESLHLENKSLLSCLNIHGEVPLLRKAAINLHEIYERDVNVVAGMVNFISHVEELSLHLKESEVEKYPFPILLESGKDVPDFHKLEHLDLSLCFHEHNLKAVTTMLHNCPALKSLKLVHEVPEFTGAARGRKRKDWGSRLPRNSDGNYRYAYFNNLHLEENRKQVIKLLSKKCSSN